MANYSFSAKETKPHDIKLVEEVKLSCSKQGLNFSALILTLLREYHDARTREVSNSK